MSSAPPSTGAATAAPRTGLSFSFSLPAARSTSAGIYAPDGSLVRTLWGGERLAAGAYTRSWDQRDDSGALLAAGDYTVKVVHHDVQYVWEGVIGNSSALTVTPTLHRSFLVPASLAPRAGGMSYAVGYNEQQSGINGFTLAAPQVNQSTVRLADPFVSVGLIASDGQRMYWANTAAGLAKNSFIGAFDVATGAQTVFAAGAPLCLEYRGTACFTSYASVLELRNDADSPPTGIAVQTNGSVLAVAYGADNAIRLYDKVTGQLRQILPVALTAKASNQIAMAPNGDLWVISGGTLLRYGSLTSTPTLIATAGPLVKPLAVTVDPHDDNTVWVADGGSSQQLKRFDATGALQKTLGRAGGYANAATIADDRLCFMFNRDREQTALAVDDTHAVWVVDTCNNRMLKLSADGSLADQIAYLPTVYAAAVDTGNPKRVFANFLEYTVDYSKDLSDPRAWTLVRNWLPVLPAALSDSASANSGFGGFRTVQTMSNGRTYAVIGVNDQPTFVELTADGLLRPSTALRPPASNETQVVLYENGELGYSTNDGMRQSAMRLSLLGFDAAGNPNWSGSAKLMASGPAMAGAPVDPPGTWTGVVGARFPVTDSGQVIFFNPSVDATSGFHLGAVAVGASRWNWAASPSAPLDAQGSFQTRKDDPNIQYGGNLVFASGHNLVYGYHGEFYTDLGSGPGKGKVGQANQFMHFRDDGLFIGQFGVPSTRATSTAQPGVSGNAFSFTLLRVGGVTYLYHNDEFTHGGVNRWRLDGADDIQELTATGAAGSSLSLN